MRYITVYQSLNKTDYRFRNYEFATKHGFSLRDYKPIYSFTMTKEDGEYSLENVLKKAYEMEGDATGGDHSDHKLSVSDLLEFNDSFYYICSDGLKLVTA